MTLYDLQPARYGEAMLVCETCGASVPIQGKAKHDHFHELIDRMIVDYTLDEASTR